MGFKSIKNCVLCRDGYCSCFKDVTFLAVTADLFGIFIGCFLYLV